MELEVWESAQEVAADRLKRTRRQQEQVAWGMQGQQERLQDYSRKVGWGVGSFGRGTVGCAGGCVLGSTGGQLGLCMWGW